MSQPTTTKAAAPLVVIKIFRTGETHIEWATEPADAMPETVSEVLSVYGAVDLAASSVKDILKAIITPSEKEEPVDDRTH